MKLIKPVSITDAILIGTDVPEDDYDEWVAGDPYTVDGSVIVTTAGVHKVYECIAAVSAGVTADVLDDACNSFTGWTDADYHGAETTISPAGQFKFDSTLQINSPYASVSRNIGSPPNTFTIEVKTYFDALGTLGDGDHAYLSYQSGTWRFVAEFSSGGLFIFKVGGASTEVGTDEVKCNTNAQWQIWRFEITKTVEADATCDVYLKNDGETVFTQIGTAIDCDYVAASTDGFFNWRQYGLTTDNRISHVDTFKVATGLGRISTTDDSPENNSTNWLEVSPTNRWAAFDSSVGTQVSQAEAVSFALFPGATVDSFAFLKTYCDSIQVVSIDTDDDLVTNGTAWTGATGTTQPTSWDKVATPADYTIDSGMVKITTDAVNEGMSQTIAVTAGTEYQLFGIYKNTAGDLAQYAVYDVTHSADILATTDMPSSTANSIFSYVFTTPAGCVSVKISFLGKASGDIVWFDTIRLAPTGYNETITMVPSGMLQKTEDAEFDLVSSLTALITMTFTYSGGTVLIGTIIIGEQANIGETQYNSSIGIHDYSVKETNSFGIISVLERAYSDKAAYDVIIPTASITYVRNLLAQYRATPILYAGDTTISALILYGFYKDFTIVVVEPSASLCSIDIEGLT